MQSQERDLIQGLYDRLKAYESQPRDPEAERLIAGLLASQPGASYLLTQTVLVQEQALKAAQEKIAQLEAQQGGSPAAGQGFLSSAPKLGPWGSAPGQAAPQPVPSTRSPLQAAVAPQPQGGGFLRTALATAAGVAGGALLFDSLRGMFGGHNSEGALSSGLGGAGSPSPLMPPDQLSSAELAQDDGASDDYDLTSDNSGSDDSSFDSDDV
jgi:hypothetical protein